MMWRELYSGLTIRRQKDQPDCDIPNYFTRMMYKETFALDPFHIVDDEAGQVKAVLSLDQPINVYIKQALVKSYNNLELTCETVGVLPPGIVDGVYILKFGDTGFGRYEPDNDCYELPVDMFEDGEVPEDELEDELSHWSERTYDDEK